MVIKVIILSASANKLSNLKQQAASYAALIMEELDPDHLGYIEVSSSLEPFLLKFIFVGLSIESSLSLPNFASLSRCGNLRRY